MLKLGTFFLRDLAVGRGFFLVGLQLGVAFFEVGRFFLGQFARLDALLDAALPKRRRTTGVDPGPALICIKLFRRRIQSLDGLDVGVLDYLAPLRHFAIEYVAQLLRRAAGGFYPFGGQALMHGRRFDRAGDFGI